MLIGICGKAGVGKDTIADHLCKTQGFTKYAFASPIKEACKVIFGWNDRHLYGDLKEVVDPRYGVSPRHAMQTLGTEWGRDCINKDIWITLAGRFCSYYEKVVICDVRFQNEVNFIESEGGHIFLVNRSRDAVEVNHRSEIEIDDIRFNPNTTYWINNNSNIPVMLNRVDDYVSKFYSNPRG